MRSSSHTLEVEKGRHSGVIRENRVCHLCNVLEDEQHFVLNCKINSNLREILFKKLSDIHSYFVSLNSIEKFKFILDNGDPQIQTWFGKFVYESFELRNEFLKNIANRNPSQHHVPLDSLHVLV